MLDAARHEPVVGAHAGKDLGADCGVDRRLHGRRIEKLSAFVAEALLEKIAGENRFARQGRAVDAFRGERFRYVSADLGKLFPVRWRRQLVTELLTETLPDLRPRENVLAVVQQEDVAIVENRVDAAIDRHVVPECRGNTGQFLAKAEPVDEGVERLQRPHANQIGSPGRDDIDDVECSGTCAMLDHDLGENLIDRYFDDLDFHARQLLPKRPGVVQKVEGLQAGLPFDSQRGAGEFLRLFDRALCRPRALGVGELDSQKGRQQQARST